MVNTVMSHNGDKSERRHENGDKKAKSKRWQVKTAKVKTMINPIMSVSLCVDLNLITVSVTVVVHLRSWKFHPQIELR